jgi:hypothetical protein
LITSAEFKTTVENYVEQQSGDSLPGPGEVVVVGHADEGWKRLRIKRSDGWVAGWMVRTFIRKWKIDRVAIVLSGDAPREFRVGFAERDGRSDTGEITDRRLARLVGAAHKQWSQAPRPLRRIWGRPWPVAVLPVLLLVEVGPFVVWTARHGLYASPVSDAYYAMIVATALAFWFQIRISFGLGVGLAAVQLVRTVVLFQPLIVANGFGVEAFWLAAYLCEPAVILMLLWTMHADAARHSVPSGPPERIG